MISRSNNRRKIFTQRTVLAVSGLLIIFVILGNTGFISIGGGLAKPFLGIGNIFKNVGNGISVYFSSRASYEEKIAELEEKVATLEAERFLLSVVQSENKELRDTLDKANSNSGTILSKILVKQNKNVYGTMILDQGENDGVVVGAKVFAEGFIVLGEIVEVMKNTSLARLYSAPGLETPARFSLSKLDVTLHGRGGGSFAVYLPHDVFVAPDEVVTLTNDGTNVVAHFVSSNTDPRDPEQTIYLRTPVNINTENFVQIEKLQQQNIGDTNE